MKENVSFTVNLKFKMLPTQIKSKRCRYKNMHLLKLIEQLGLY